jgi:hypothetical protein
LLRLYLPAASVPEQAKQKSGRWCLPCHLSLPKTKSARIGGATRPDEIMSPNRSIGLVQGASFRTRLLLVEMGLRRCLTYAERRYWRANQAPGAGSVTCASRGPKEALPQLSSCGGQARTSSSQAGYGARAQSLGAPKASTAAVACALAPATRSPRPRAFGLR